MNPYEAPQSSLEPERKPLVPVKYESYDSFEVVKIILISFLVLFEGILGVLLLHSLALTLGLQSGGENEILDQLLPYLAAVFCFVSWILWRIKKASDRKNS